MRKVKESAIALLENRKDKKKGENNTSLITMIQYLVRSNLTKVCIGPIVQGIQSRMVENALGWIQLLPMAAGKSLVSGEQEVNNRECLYSADLFPPPPRPAFNQVWDFSPGNGAAYIHVGSFFLFNPSGEYSYRYSLSFFSLMS